MLHSHKTFNTHWNIQNIYNCLGLFKIPTVLFSAAKTCCVPKSVCQLLLTSAAGLKRVLQAGSGLSLSRCRQFWTMAALPWGFTLHWDHCVTYLCYIFAACSNIHITSWCLCAVCVGFLAVSVWGWQFHCSPTDLLVVNVLVSAGF